MGAMATIRRTLALSGLLLLSSLSGVTSGAESFSDTHEIDSLPAGWQAIAWNGNDNQTHWGQIYYPSNASGLGQPIDNTSGPFPLLIWIGDEGESSDQYDWLGKTVATSGYIIIVLPPDWNSDNTMAQCSDILALWYRLVYNNQNGSLVGDPANMQDAFDLDHWGIGGHGVGAKQAATCQLLMTGEWNGFISNPPPTALIALGLEDANTNVPRPYLGQSPDPGMGLYLTGTMDDIAKADTNVDVWLANHAIPWHYMSVIGANHVQYQDETTFWESFNDGNAQIEPEEQQNHANEHIVPYLDLMLKGEHSQWLNATNREVNWQNPSDSISYIYEDLRGARFMPMVSNSSDVNEMEGLSGRVVSVNTQLTHRNGALPIGTTILCTIYEGGDWWDPMDFATYGINATGTFTSSVDNGNTSATDCEVSTEGVPPGNRTLIVEVNWYGMPSYLELGFFRENREPTLVSPAPVIEVPQHGSASIPFSDFVTDPDGTSLIVEMLPHLPSSHQMHCYLDANTIVCDHTGEAEWNGTEILNLTIYDRYDTNFSTHLNLSANVFPIDDSVVQIADIPELNIDEDSPQQSVSITSHFEDPEGMNATIINASTSGGLDLSWTNDNLAIQPQLNWHGINIIEVWVGDGTSAPIAATFTVNVAPIPDGPRLNLTRVSLVEDTPLEIPLSELGWDEDGESVEFEIEGNHSHLTVTILSNVLRIVPASDWSGLSAGWNLTVTSADGNSTGPIEFEVSEVNDPIQLTWGPLETDADADFVVAIHDPDDETPWTVRTRWDGLVWSEFIADCTASDPSLENPHDWECSISNSMSDLYPGAHRLEVQVYENNSWTEEKIYYHTVPVPASNSTNGDNSPVDTVESGIESFSIWVVFAIVVAGVVAIIGLYMIATLSKDDMEEMLGNPAPSYSREADEFSDLEVELVEYD